MNLRPFITPSFVISVRHASDIGSPEGPSIPLREIEADDLSKMCDTFRAEVFRKADKADPRQA